MNKLKLCPFCGSEVESAYRSGGVCLVRCACCNTDGPAAFVEDYLDFSDDITNEEWNEAVDKAKAAAVEKWNTRPPMTNMTPEELVEAEKKQRAEICERAKVEQERAEAEYMKSDIAALYGANCREG